jgi:hypothetical protein
MSDLFGYFNKPRIDSEGQLRAAQQKAKTYTSEQNARARASGFRDANEEELFMRQRSRKSGGTVPGGSGRASLDSMLSWHPRNTINRATDAMRTARGR